MTAQLTLHIGAAKTGSSAIQAFLRRNAQALGEQGYVVPDQYLGLSSSVTGEHVWAIQEFVNNSNVAGFTSRLEQALELVGSKNLLISAENLSNLGNHAIAAGICAKVKARVVLYIRRQDELLTSTWQQWHSKVERDFNAWLLRAVKTYGRWDQLISDWEGVVGKGNVDVRIFERDRLLHNDLLRDFVACLGLDAQSAEFDYELGVINPSFSDVITPLVAGNRRLFENTNDNQFFQFILRMDKNAFSEGKKASLITRDVRDGILEFYKDINEAVRVTHFPNYPILFSRVDHSRYMYYDTSTLVAEQMRILIEMIYRVAQNTERRQ